MRYAYGSLSEVAEDSQPETRSYRRGLEKDFIPRKVSGGKSALALSCGGFDGGSNGLW